MKNRTQTLAKRASVVVATIALLGAAGLTAQADTPGAHPYYLHALSDLRDARALLTAGDEQNVEQNEGAAIIEIDQALGGLRRAAIDDGKPVNYHPPVDANLSHRDRLNRALTLIGKAHQDITRPEADPAALGWRRDAVTHVDRAYGDTKQAIRADYGDDHPFVPGSHPHFLHAISDLRAARALLNAPDEGNVVSDERIATRAINEAIRAAKQGSVDDGLDIFYNPPAATNLPRHDRLAQARKLISDAHSEETRFRETDPRADQALHASVSATDRAAKAVGKAIRDDRNDDNPASQ